jgi:hypothetical protein
MGIARAAHARNIVGPLIRSTYRIHAKNQNNVPAHGAVVIVCEWNNIAAPSVLKAALPRPLHVWADGPAGVPGPLLSITGDLAMPVTRIGVDVVHRATELLRAGEAVAALGVDDLGYALASTSAPILPVLVQAPATKRPTDPPARKSSIEVQVGDLQPFPEHLRTDVVTRASVLAAGEWARQVLVDSRRAA